MTTVVYRNGVLAADSRSSYRTGLVVPGPTEKVWTGLDGALIGGAGDSNQINAFRRWIDEGRNDSVVSGVTFNDLHILLVTRDGTIFEFDDGLFPDMYAPGQRPWAAIGSGASIATGALAMGATAEQAVEIAIQNDLCSGGPVQMVSLAGVLEEAKSVIV